MNALPSLAPIARTVARHLAAVAALLLLAAAWTFPLATRVPTHIPGGGAGDNVAFLWNFWWMRHALTTGSDAFHTTSIFAPAGVDLTLHTHTALPAWIGATVLASFPIVAALNVTILASMFLNGFTAYLCAWRLTRDRAASVIAGTIFGGSPFVAAHLNGHFNLTTAWTVPLFALTASEAMARRSLPWAVMAGVVLGLTAYVDYYLVVYQAGFALCLTAVQTMRSKVSIGPRTRAVRAAGRVAGGLAAAALLILIGVSVTGGGRIELGGVAISLRSGFNLLQAFWILAAIRLWCAFPVRVRVTAASGEWRRDVGRLAAIAGTSAAIAAPLIWRAIDLVSRGEYVTQRYYWRNAPKGVDLATLLLGNPFHGWWGPQVRRAYAAMDIDPIEASLWLGVVPAGLVGWCVARQWHEPIVRRWSLIGGVFFVWALGPHLMAFGENTGLILPQALLRYLPILSNARIPGRAIVVVYLAAALLAAIAVARWRPASPRRAVLLCVLIAGIALDYAPAPFPLFALDRPAIYETLRNRAEPGALCELPLGVRDGFGERGFLDHRVLFYQSIHERPVAGGFVARLSPSVVAAYEGEPLLGALLRLSGKTGEAAELTLPDRDAARRSFRATGIRFVMLNRTEASARLIGYVEQTLPLALIQVEGDRSLYVVEGWD